MTVRICRRNSKDRPKKIGQDKAMEMLKGAEQGFKDNYALLKKLSEM
ncbi:MAG: hypothetical protein IKQ17_06550 [Kiritimatiellae bacterium]|nr:hypothetical protein [Kiritimatiellia bacterium]